MTLLNTMLVLCSLATLASCLPSPTCGATSNSLVVRVRLENGSIDKIQVDSDDTSLNRILQQYSRPSDATILVGNKIVDDDSLSLSSLGFKNGSMITIRLAANTTATATDVLRKSTPSFAVPKATFQPFPELAKNLQSAIRARSRRRSSGLSSYGDLANIQSSLHVVEPQPKGRIHRVYMCATSAARFHSSCIARLTTTTTTTETGSNRVGLLLGSIHSERVDLKPPKARTSLSSMPSAQDYCQVAKVHTLWEPPQEYGRGRGESYDASSLLKRDDSFQRVLRVANYLGLEPIGWIFSYSENRHDADGLPVWAQDVKTGSLLQIEEMKERESEGAKFVTLAMSATTGATEAFQISDVAVQMVSEGLLLDGTARIVSTQCEVVVDGRETNMLDTVLCLVNTALLSHTGTYAGGDSAKKSTKKNGNLTTKAKKAILQAIDNDSALLSLLSDFYTLLALDIILLPQEMKDLCSVLQKWTRGQKQGTQVSDILKRKLKSVLQS